MAQQIEAVLFDFRQAVRNYPNLVWHHCRHSQSCEGNGLPDLLIIGPGAILWRECKPHAGARISPAQTWWRYAIQAYGADWAIWTPEDVTSGKMAADLARAAGLSVQINQG